jgi:hypothetical protein
MSKFQTSTAMIHKTKEAEQKKAKMQKLQSTSSTPNQKVGAFLPSNKKGDFHPESNRGRPCTILNHTN